MSEITDALGVIGAALNAESLRSLQSRLPTDLRPPAGLLDRAAPPSEEQLKRAIAVVFSEDPKAAHLIQLHMFPFSDLRLLKDAEIQTVMMHVDNPTLIQALLGAEEALTARILKNLSARRRDIVNDDLQRAEREEVELAQRSILDEVRRQYDVGHIDTYFGSAERWVGGPSEKQTEEERPKKKRAPKTSPRSGRKLRWIAIVVVAAVVMWLVVGMMGSQLDQAKSHASAEKPRRSGGVISKKKGTDRSSQGSQQNKQQRPQTLAPGESLKTGRGGALVRAVGGASVSAESGSELQQRTDPDSGAGPLYLRLGRVQVVILEDDFVLETPVVQVSGSKGARFDVTVVLDATTDLRVRRGRLRVESTLSTDRWKMGAGERGTFEPGGSAHVRNRGAQRE
jgi:hypothetical protein